jgi:signal transduction histidine kinase
MNTIRILLVEDDLDDARMIQLMVRKMRGPRYELTAVTSLAAALNALKRDVDIILLDLSLPDAVGIDTVTQLRQRDPHTPVIVLTGNDDEEIAVQAVPSWAQDYLVKWDFNHYGLSRAIYYAVQRRKAEDKLREAKELAEAASRAKSEFLASVSHEIRTPMNAIIGMADVLARNPPPEEQRQYVEILRGAGEGLLHLVDDLLDLSRIEAGKLTLEETPFELDELLEGVLALFGPRAAEAKLELGFTRSPDVPASVVGDPHRLRQILMNLVGNALKFTKRGRISVVVDRDPARREAGAVRFAVVDTGVGIPRDKLESIFSTFTQGDLSTSRLYGGTGLGLSICKSLLRLMHGTIGVTSEVGRGSRFVFTARFGMASEAEVVQPPKRRSGVMPAARIRTRPLRILLVDDSVDNEVLVRAYLADTGHQMDVVRDGPSAIREFAARAYDAVLMDVHMPTMDGYEATRELRALELERGAARTPVLAVTADAFAESVARAIEAGCDGHLAKPILRAALLEALDRCATETERDRGRARVEVDADLARITTSYLEKRRRDVQGVQALLSKDALDDADLDRIFTVGHNLKGTGASYGLPELTALGDRLAEATKRREVGAGPVRAAVAALSSYLDRVDVVYVRSASLPR